MFFAPRSPRPRPAPSAGAAPLRRWRPPTDDEIGWWPITFSDLVLLLLCFVVLWHVSEKRREHVAARDHATPVALAPQTSAEQPPSLSEEARSVSVQEMPDNLPDQRSQAWQFEPPEQSVQLEPATVRPSAAQDDWRELQAQLESYIRGHGLGHVVGVISSEHGLVISISDTVTFPSGQATLSSAVTPLLSQVAALASERPDLDIEIAGHTDDRPIATPEFPSNWELSAARASRVARALLEQGHIDPGRISTRGYAHYRPVQANDSDAHRAANRRVEVRFFHQVQSSY